MTDKNETTPTNPEIFQNLHPSTQAPFEQSPNLSETTDSGAGFEDAGLLRERDKVQIATLLALSRSRTKRDYRRLASLSARLTQQEQTGKQWGDADTAELEALLAQYTSLREESMNTINNRVQVMMLGIAAIGALVAGVLTIDNPAESKLLIFAIFSIAIPLVAVFVLLVWVSEAVRSHRVGYFLAADGEARINAKLGRLY